MRMFSPMIVGLLAVAGSVVDAPHAAPSGAFEPIASVVMHPRCINCHQDQSPRQGDARTVHLPLVVRGKDGHGAPTQPCQTCHQTTMGDAASVGALLHDEMTSAAALLDEPVLLRIRQTSRPDRTRSPRQGPRGQDAPGRRVR